MKILLIPLVFEGELVLACHRLVMQGGSHMRAHIGLRTWTGRIIAAFSVVGLCAFLMSVGTVEADQRGSAISAVLALLALLVPALRDQSRAATAHRTTPEAATTNSGMESSSPPVALTSGAIQGVQINNGGANVQRNHFFGSR
jgi:hypothetical protein